jgi:mannose-6-phosphate isomerase-like protein (cupin superfamily)
MRPRLLIVAFAVALVAPRAAVGQAASQPVVTHLTGAELRVITDSLAARAAREPGRQIPGQFVTRDSVLSVLLLRRDTSGRPEIHERVTDIFVIQAGRATVVTGGRVEGARLMEPGEWNGGQIVQDTGRAANSVTRRTAVPGDVVVIPAGLPHQVEVPRGEFVTYLILKVLDARSSRAP